MPVRVPRQTICQLSLRDPKEMLSADKVSERLLETLFDVMNGPKRLLFSAVKSLIVVFHSHHVFKRIESVLSFSVNGKNMRWKNEAQTTFLAGVIG